jgi:hypothetical protein
LSAALRIADCIAHHVFNRTIEQFLIAEYGALRIRD